MTLTNIIFIHISRDCMIRIYIENQSFVYNIVLNSNTYMIKLIMIDYDLIIIIQKLENNHKRCLRFLRLVL